MAVQADTGSSLAEAARHIDRLRLQLSTLESMSGSVERSILTRYEDGSTDIDENEVPLLTKALRILSERGFHFQKLLNISVKAYVFMKALTIEKFHIPCDE